ncbi:hypothetical protein H1D32_16505 [Anaerobacillus sp. CMMVII]|uniref:hypothetical protein n=1 Tax=Anaerobacillus sp. CMMVII TaxID=2755588 RepID=UPI0021B73F06|nr:hypothetical protein [Anaerobacillus sp. CMMVII]MCT8139164.1 hypothetical protein [Anaerobacillus sp. CMMVII]
MANEKNQNNNENNVAEGIKNTAGAAFHAVHRGLEVTEDAAMNAVDATANAVKNVNRNKDNNQ